MVAKNRFTAPRQRLKSEGFCCGHGDEAIYCGVFLVHDRSRPEKGRETMLRFIRVSVKKERLVRRREARREGGMP